MNKSNASASLLFEICNLWRKVKDIEFFFLNLYMHRRRNYVKDVEEIILFNTYLTLT